MTDGIAERIVASLRPSSMANLTPATIADPMAAGVDLVNCIDVLDHVPQQRALDAIQAMAQAAQRILFVGASPAEPLPPYAKPMPWWLRRFAEAGLQPEWRYDAGFIAPNAVLLRQGGQASADPAMFAELLRQRAAKRELQSRAADLAEALRTAETACLDMARKADSLAAQLAAAQHERDAILNSTTWRATAPLRSVLGWGRRPAAPAPDTDPAPDPAPADLAKQPDHSARAPAFPASSQALCVLIPIGPATDARVVPAALGQLPANWRLCLVETGLLSNTIEQTVEDAAGDSRVSAMRVMSLDGLSPTVGMALAQAGAADFAMLAAPGAILAPHALLRVAAEIAAHPDADLIYADDDRVDAQGCRSAPFHKPAWSIDLALEQNLVGGFCVFRRSFLGKLDATLPIDDGMVHDLAVRAAESPRRIHHVPEILSHRTAPLPSAPAAAAVKAVIAGWQHGPARPSLIPSSFGQGRNRIRWNLQAPEPRVSLIVPTRDRPELLARCAEAVLERTDYPNLELIVADNDSREPETRRLLARLQQDPRARVVSVPGPFNYSAINNAAAATAAGEVLVLLNNDVDVISSAWLREMVGHAMRPDVGAVGARLLFGNGTIQHAGVVLGVGQFEGGPGIAGHFGFHAPAADEGYGEQFVLTREVSAVTGACLALRRPVFQQVGGLDETNLPVALNDVDLCLRIRALGLRMIWTPFAELYHLESASRGSDQDTGPAERFRRECRYLRDRWGAVLDADPFYNPNFSRADHSFQLGRPEARGCVDK